MDDVIRFLIGAAAFVFCVGRCQANLENGHVPRGVSWALFAVAVALIVF